MTNSKRAILIVLIILNLMVLMGQVYPEGAPPFARTINILFLISSLAFFLSALRKRKG
ncbi:MAG TPA: hypothetical protein PK509_06265 [Catalimonadaceae bacterium]|nr:hypothetical protein [Catalimonadaceae bacterium]HPI10725.1 hypothetical protein [Catalimonadaceae bacterium]